MTIITFKFNRHKEVKGVFIQLPRWLLIDWSIKTSVTLVFYDVATAKVYVFPGEKWFYRWCSVKNYFVSKLYLFGDDQ